MNNDSGLTEMDTDNDGGSILPDASESTVADHDDRNDFLKAETNQTVNVYITKYDS